MITTSNDTKLTPQGCFSTNAEETACPQLPVVQSGDEKSPREHENSESDSLNKHAEQEDNKYIVNSLYEQRQKLIIIGLTGRTGAGCSTVANILASPYNQVNQSIDRAGDERRKYDIIHRYLAVNWDDKFEIIRASNLILHEVVHEHQKLEQFLEALNLRHPDDDTPAGDEKANKTDSTAEELEKNYKTIQAQCEQAESVLVSQSNEQDSKAVQAALTYIEGGLAEFRLLLESIYSKPRIARELQRVANGYRQLHRFNTGKEENPKSIEPRSNLESNCLGSDSGPDFLAKKIDSVIQLIKTGREKKSTKSKLIVIDSLRNLYEIAYFKSKYPSFYLISVNMSYEQRVQKLGYDSETLKELDGIKDDKKSFSQTYQDIDLQKCIESSDIYLSNTGNKRELAAQVAHYVALIFHPGLVPPSDVERCMQIAHSAKLSSGCLSRQVGAAVTNENFAICSVGWNTTPEGQIPCSLRNLSALLDGSDSDAFSDYEKTNPEFCKKCAELMSLYNAVSDKNSGNEDSTHGLHLAYCFKDIYNEISHKKNQVHTRSIHAEEHAFLNVAKYGYGAIQGGKLFTTASCCELCAKKAYHLGIKEIYYVDLYPGISEEHIINTGTKRPKMIHYTGAIGEAYTRLYTPLLPLKDELELLTGVQVKTDDKNKPKQ